jgi:phospholipid/cholesterol/gamma-HCH transport system substrate-binding protein
MSRGRGTAALVASPVLIGSVAVLLVAVAVFIAYNANAGLPFVPTYNVNADLPSGSKLVAGNEVRVGGFRVGVVERVTPKQIERGRAIASIAMKLDKRVEPLSRDTTLTVRPRSALGLKYVELRPGRSKRTLAAGATIPLRNSSTALELEDVYSTFDARTRPAVRVATAGFGDSLAGRGASLNAAIEGLRPLVRELRPVMANLASPATGLDQLFPQLARLGREVAPVAALQAALFTDMADTFAAISDDPRALQATVERSPPALQAGISSFRVQRPFLADFTTLSRRLQPAADELPKSLPELSSAVRVGRPVLGRSVALSRRLAGVNRALERLFANLSTLLTLKDLRTALTVSRPAIEYLAPYQTVCNNTLAFFNQLGIHFGAPANAGTSERILLKQANNRGQRNNLGTTASSRPADVPAGQDPQTASNAFGKLEVLHGQPYSPAIDAQGNADCQAGQFGYLDRLGTGGRYPPSTDPNKGGGNHVVVDSNTPGLSGPTYKGRELGIYNLRDVP